MVVLVAGDNALVDLGERVFGAIVGSHCGVLLVEELGLLWRTGDAAREAGIGLRFGALDALELASKDTLIPAKSRGVEGAQSRIGLGLWGKLESMVSAAWKLGWGGNAYRSFLGACCGGNWELGHGV